MKEHLLAELLAALAFVVFVVTAALIFAIATLLLLKALLLERLSDFGRSNGRNNLAMSLAYYVAFFSIWIAILKHPAIHGAMVVIILATSIGAIREFVRIYGGWRATLVEAAEAVAELLIEVRSWPAAMYRNIRAFLHKILHGYRKIGLLLALLALLGVLVALGVLGHL